MTSAWRGRTEALAVCVAVALWWPAARASASAADHSIERLNAEDQAVLHELLAQLEPLITQRKHEATVNLLTFEELYVPLNREQRAFLDWIRSLTPEDAGGVHVPLGAAPHTLAAFERIESQAYTDSQHQRIVLDPQYLPDRVLAAYRRLASAMERDIGRRLLVESGYRAPAYQLYLFCFYLPTHDMSVRETNRFVALPGYSEHGAPQRQAIDFINNDGVNGDGKPESFEALPEYHWLQQHAQEYGFALSYPRDNPWATSFEPWHWHYEER